jgi:hypothetical protein
MVLTASQKKQAIPARREAAQTWGVFGAQAGPPLPAKEKQAREYGL